MRGTKRRLWWLVGLAWLVAGPAGAGVRATAGAGCDADAPGLPALLGTLSDDRLRGGPGDDRLCAGDGDDRLWGEQGDDLLLGEAGDDTYLYRPGDGHDVVRDRQGHNRLFLMRIPEGRARERRRGRDLLIRPEGGGSVRLVDFFAGADFEVVYDPVNVVIVLADDLGYGDLGSYGQRQIATPRLDRMAAEGLRFTDFYAGAPSCAPSRNTLVSGLHTGHTFIRANTTTLSEDAAREQAVLARALHERGYRTGMFGKWGLAAPPGSGAARALPEDVGFDEFTGFLTHRDAHVHFLDSPATDTHDPEHPFYRDVRQRLFRIEEGRSVLYAIAPDRYVQDEFVEGGLDFVERHRDEPFFLYLPLTIPHAELVVPASEPSLERYAPGGVSLFPESAWLGNANFKRHNPAPRATYAAMITRLDRDMGRLLDQIDALGLAETTVVFFTSDNGPHAAGGIGCSPGGCVDGPPCLCLEDLRQPDVFASNGGLRGGPARTLWSAGKFTLWEGGIRVPLIVRWPGVVRAGRTTRQPAALWDLLPTAAEIAGFEPPPATDGVSLLPLLQGRRPRGHDYLYWEVPLLGFDTIQAVRKGRWKAVRRGVGSGGGIELYDLWRDPGEQCDLVDPASPCFHPRHERTLQRLIPLFEEARTPPDDGSFPIPPVTP